MNLGVMGICPGRRQIAPLAIGSINDQLDRPIVILNEFGEVPSHFPHRLPEHDLKDVAMFSVPARHNAYVFTLDDDIDYPPGYVRLMREHDRRLGIANAVVGLHGTVYLPSKLIFTQPARPRQSMDVDSTGRRNTLCKLLCRRMIVQRFSGSVVEFSSNGVELGLAVCREIGAFHVKPAGRGPR